jgi:ATP-dependent Lon protease
MQDTPPSNTTMDPHRKKAQDPMTHTKDVAVQTDRTYKYYESDPDYEPSEEEESEDEEDDTSDEDIIEYDEEEDEEEDSDEEEDEDDNDDTEKENHDLENEEGGISAEPSPQPQQLVHMQPMVLFLQPPPPPPSRRTRSQNPSPEPPQRKRTRDDEYQFTQYLTKEEKAYWKTLEGEEKTKLVQMEKILKESDKSGLVPMRFKILASDMDTSSKNMVLAKLDQFQCMHEGSGEYYKLRNWLNAVSRLPLGRHFPLPVTPADPALKIARYLQDVRMNLDNTVYGHGETKDQIMRILAQWVSNPSSKGNCIGIQGPAGVGKTTLVKEGVCKALKLPFGFIALGGAGDGAFLEGHSFTYEGSMYGKIAEILMKTQCMNPVFFFDELDKVSGTRRGEEVIGILTHLTDSSQNERFQDRYFGELELNLSKALIVFSYNDESLINPILKDRMITIRVNGYNTSEKLRIASDYLLPEILEQYKLTKKDIQFPKGVIEYIIQRVAEEDGVRNLKRGLEAIVSWINMHRYLPPEGETIAFPYMVTEELVRKYLRPADGPSAMKDEIARMMYI